MSTYFKGQKESWKEQTRSDQLFLSTATHLNSEQLKPIYHKFTSRFPIVLTDRISNKIVVQMIKHCDVLRYQSILVFVHKRL